MTEIRFVKLVTSGHSWDLTLVSRFTKYLTGSKGSMERSSECLIHSYDLENGQIFPYWNLFLKLINSSSRQNEKITSVKEVWLPSLYWHRFWRFIHFRLLFRFCFDWKDISNTQDSVSLASQTPLSNFVKNTPLRVVFSTLFSVFGYPEETPFFAFDILH